MRRLLFLLCFLPILIAEDSDFIDSDDADLTVIFWCGVIDPYNVYNSRLIRVQSVPNIEINDAGIVNIRTSVFNHCEQTVSLSMANNQLAYLTGKRLEGLRNLMQANFFNNVIEDIANGTFDELTHLRELDLSYNRLKGVTAGVRSGLKELRKLHLNQNPIVLGEDGFSGLSKLELLELAGANISAIPIGSFNGLDNLERLDLSSNQLTDVSEPRFELLNNLEELDLSMNQISKISEDTFKGLTKLKALWLNENRIGTLRIRNTFEWIPNLENLYLHQNPLQFLDVVVFKEMESAVIEPGFIINFSDTIRKNFANSTFNLYHCSRLYSEVTTLPIPNNTESENFEYFSPYYCNTFTPTQLVEVAAV